MEHLLGEQGKRAGESVPHHRVRGNDARAILPKGVDQVIRRALEDGEEAQPHEGATDARPDPVDVARRRPREDEQPRRQREGADHHGRQPRFGHGLAMVRVQVPNVEPLVLVAHAAAERAPDQDGE